jgi:transcriptional regulator with XRE-family HTH domain
LQHCFVYITKKVNKKFTKLLNKLPYKYSDRINHASMDEQFNFSKRLKTAMQGAGYTARASVLEREFNLRYWGKSVTLQAVRRWLNGEAVPTQDKLKTLAEWLDVDPHWLRFGERLHGSVQEQRKRWDVNMTQEERAVVEAFMALAPDKRKIVGEVVKAFAHCSH